MNASPADFKCEPLQIWLREAPPRCRRASSSRLFRSSFLFFELRLDGCYFRRFRTISHYMSNGRIPMDWRTVWLWRVRGPSPARQPGCRPCRRQIAECVPCRRSSPSSTFPEGDSARTGEATSRRHRPPGWVWANHDSHPMMSSITAERLVLAGIERHEDVAIARIEDVAQTWVCWFNRHT